MKKVYLVGGGPGDPELITIRGMKLLSQADVVIYDRLISRKLLKYTEPETELIYVGKSSGKHPMKQEEINQLLVEKAGENRVVVRLKGGDPFIFGRGAEEISALVKAEIEFEVVPGVTSAISVPELSCIPLTHRELSSSITLVTGHFAPGNENRVDFSALMADTLVILMGVNNLPEIVPQLLKRRNENTPVAIIEKGTTEEQRIILGNLGNIVEKAKDSEVKPPAVTVVGEVVNLREIFRRGSKKC